MTLPPEHIYRSMADHAAEARAAVDALSPEDMRAALLSCMCGAAAMGAGACALVAELNVHAGRRLLHDLARPDSARH